MRRFFRSLVATAVIGGSVLTASGPAAAADDIESYLDNQFDNASTYDGRGDIDAISAHLRRRWWRGGIAADSDAGGSRY